MPKVSTAICKKCSRLKKCSDYKLFEQPLLFPRLKVERPYPAKRVRRFKDPENTQPVSHEEQLSLKF